MKRGLAILALVVLFASVGAAAPIVLEYPATRDTSCIGAGQAHCNAGAMPWIRAGKGVSNSGELALIGWSDHAGMLAEIEAAAASMGVALDSPFVQCTYKIYIGPKYNDSMDATVKNLSVGAVMHENVTWYEGDSTNYDAPYDWTECTYAATWSNAAEFDPNWVCDPPLTVIDWKDPTNHWSNREFKQLPVIQNSTGWTAGDLANDAWSPPLTLDYNVWYNLLAYDHVVGIKQWGSGWGNADNVEMATKDEGRGPVMTFTIIPEPASLLLMGIGGVGLMLRRKR